MILNQNSLALNKVLMGYPSDFVSKSSVSGLGGGDRLAFQVRGCLDIEKGGAVIGLLLSSESGIGKSREWKHWVSGGSALSPI